MNPKNLKNTVIVVLILVVSFMLINTIMKAKSKRKADFKETSVVLEQNWERRMVGETGLSLKVPDGLHEVKTVLDENAKKIIEDYQAYEYTAGSFTLKINHVVAKTRLDPYGYAEKLAQMFEESPVYDSYTYSVQEQNESNVPGVFLRGSAMVNGLDMVVNSIILVSGEELWEITMIFNSANRDFKVLLNSVFNSALIQ